MKSLITGIDGFVGSHLTSLLLGRGDEVGGTFHYDPDLKLLGDLAGRVKTYNLDVRDREQVASVLEQFRPDRIFHLAAIAFVPVSFENPHLVFEVNLFGTINLCDCLLETGLKAKTLFVSTAEVYGSVNPEDLPLTEEDRPAPTNPYAVSKLAAEMMSAQYVRHHGMEIVRVRPFNHTGPGQSPKFVCSDFAKQIAEIEAGAREPVMRVGNLESRRDLSDVRDIVRAYVMALDKCEGNGEVYNLGSERSYLIRDVLDMLLNMSDAKIKVERDPEKMRPSDTPDIYGDCAKFRAATGWRPERTFRETLADTLDYWRRNVKGD